MMDDEMTGIPWRNEGHINIIRVYITEEDMIMFVYGGFNNAISREGCFSSQLHRDGICFFIELIGFQFSSYICMFRNRNTKWYR